LAFFHSSQFWHFAYRHLADVSISVHDRSTPKPNIPENRFDRRQPGVDQLCQTTGTRLAATAVGEMTSISRATRQRPKGAAAASDASTPVAQAARQAPI
jgi:hypothetical protein